MAIRTIYHLEALTGGSDSTYLDYYDGNSLSEGDRAYVIYSDTFYIYRLNATSGAAESSPNVISPDTNAGTKRWILIAIMADLTTIGAINGITFTGTAGKTLTVTQNTSLDEAVAMSSKAPKASPSFTSGIGIGGVAAGAGGVAFPATANAVADANTLDDYEEGTWTPSVGGDATYTLQTGKYIKIGRLVTLWGQLIINLLGTGSTALISGAPFTASGANGGGVVEIYAGLAINVYSAVMDIDNDGTVIWLNTQGALDANLDIQSAVLGNGASIRFKMTYLSVS